MVCIVCVCVCVFVSACENKHVCVYGRVRVCVCTRNAIYCVVSAFCTVSHTVSRFSRFVEKVEKRFVDTLGSQSDTCFIQICQSSMHSVVRCW